MNFSDRFKSFLKFNKHLLDECKFDDFYTEFKYFGCPETTCTLTILLLASGIDPINYFSYIPDNYAYSSRCSFDKINLINSDKLEGIGQFAFYNCTNLKSISIPESVTTINSYAFQNCTNLTDIAIPKNVSYIGNGVFHSCTNISNIVIPSKITTINPYTFYKCTGLTSVEIPETVSTIGNYAFYQCSNMVAKVPNGLRNVGQSAFWNCAKLTGTSTFTLDSIGSHAFGCYDSYSTNVMNVTFSSGITTIPSTCFQNCRGLNSIIIPSTVTTINEYAFTQCYNLTNATIPDTVTTINHHAFYKCSNMVAKVPNGLRNVGQSAFWNCAKLTGTSTFTLDSIEYGAFGHDAGFSSTNIMNVTFNSNITTIPSEVFLRCTGLTNVSIPDTVTTINDNAFGECVNMVAKVPNGLKNVGYCAFYNCAKLTGTSTFILDSIESFAFCGVSNNIMNVTFNSNITTIPQSAFCNCVGLTNVSIPETVTTVGSSAFYGCTNMVAKIPNGLRNVGYCSFWDCISLTGTSTFTLDSIGEFSFASSTGNGSYNTINVTFSDKITAIPRVAFQNCKGLTSITIPSQITSIGDAAFLKTNLTNVIFKDASGWYIGAAKGEKTTAISSSYLSDSSNAAIYLKSTYSGKYWSK